MATTTNFGWETPDDTDLVKDGAAAIRTALGGVDTSFVDLKGGTTGQVLSKASNTDLDFTWTADASGIPATIFDAKGDIIAATAADTASRLAVGSNDQVLTADSTAATGLKWATPASGGMTLLSTTTLSGSSTTVSSISQGYTDLYVVLKNVVQAASSTVYMRLNGTNAPNYNYGWLQTVNGTTSSNVNNGYYQIDNIFASMTGNTDNLRAGSTITIPQYTNTTNQFIFWQSVGGASGGNQGYVTGGAQFLGTNVTSVTLGSTSSTFSSGTMYIYGVK